MDFFLQRVYDLDYVKLCTHYYVHPIRYTVIWESYSIFFKKWLNNIFVKGEVFSDILMKANRTRFVLRRFFMHKLKPRRQRCNDNDLSMTPLSDWNASRLFDVHHGTKKHSFTIPDMFNLVKQALTNNVEIHACPREVVNPYTRAAFRHETLYMFYVKVRQSHCMIPMLFYHFVKVGFNLKLFLLQNECMLREYAIRSTLESMPPVALNLEIRDMLCDIRMYDAVSRTQTTIIPNALLLPCSCLHAFKPWLKAYFTYVYSLSPLTREHCYKKLTKAMIEFVRSNPEFGVVKRGVVRAVLEHPVPTLTLSL